MPNATLILQVNSATTQANKYYTSVHEQLLANRFTCFIIFRFDRKTHTTYMMHTVIEIHFKL